MIILDADRGTWLRQVLFLRGTALSVIWKRVAVSTAVATVVTVLFAKYGIFATSMTELPFSLIGLALSIFLGFRNNTGYDRFWEGRKLWGRMVNVSRSFTRQLLTLIGPRMVDEHDMHVLSEAEREELDAIRRRLVHAHIAYVHCFRQHLRSQDELAEFAGLLPEALVEQLRGELNRPVAISQWIGDQLRALYDRGWIHPQHLPVLEESLTEITTVQGACERIKSTPIPTSYTVLIHRIVGLYCVGLPFGIVPKVGIMTPIVVAIVAYAFYGLDAVGTEIEDPFGFDPNDLPLSGLSTMIEVNLRQRLGETELPPLREPINNILQ